jgi:16S rRNA (uracil1498-N3)-methyltransferase
MSIARLVVPGLFLREGILSINKEYAHHAKVLRLKPLDPIILCDGLGHEMQGIVVSLTSDELQVELNLELTSNEEKSATITLLQGIPKGDKMEFILQKATELGVTRIVPVAMSRSVAKYDKNPVRWEKIVQEASRQCGRTVLPIIETVTTFQDALKRWTLPQFSFLLDETGAGKKLHSVLPKEASEVLALVGPEGGLAPEERKAALEAGFIAVYLGKRILRTETAAITIVALLQHYYGDLG